MQVAVGAQVRTSDGDSLGKVDRLIVDLTGTVQAVVVRKGGLLPDDVVIPLQNLEADNEGNLRLVSGAGSVDRLPRFQSGDYTEDRPEGAVAPEGGVPAAAFLWPAGGAGFGAGTGAGGGSAGAAPAAIAAVAAGGDDWVGRGDPADRGDGPRPSGEPPSDLMGDQPPVVVKREDLERAVVDENSEVVGKDGQRIGQVHRLAFDANTGELTQVTVKRGGLFGDEITVPAERIAQAANGVLYLTVNADQLTDTR